MTARHAVSLWWLLVLRLRLKLDIWRYRARRDARRAVLRLIRRVLDWLEPPG